VRGLSFLEIFSQLDSSATKRGLKFEALCKWWLANDPIWSQELIRESIKLWEESPFRSGRDIGVDLTALDKLGNVWAIQVKGWDPSKSLPKKEIDKFLSASNTRQFSRRLLITTTNSISANAKRALDEQEKPVVLVSLQDLEESEAWHFFSGNLDKGVKGNPKKLLPHQEAAKKQVINSLKSIDRGQLIMACGSGKTLTAQRIAEEMNSHSTLVLLPSLLLLQQTLQAWRKDALEDFAALSVCSDITVARDEPLSKIRELPFPVTTDPKEIEKFLKVEGKKVIFSTYQSSDRLSIALKKSGTTFDLVICDEAHRLAGKLESSYGTVLKKDAIPTTKMLFMTATPRIFSTKEMDNSDTELIEINSMDDETKFGKVLFRFSFGEAIDKGILTDYRVIVIGVSDNETKNLISKRTLINEEGSTLDAELLAAHYGLAKAMVKHSMKRVISFHSRVEKAKDFSQLFPGFLHQVSGVNEGIYAQVISGKDPSSERKLTLSRLKELGNNERGLVTNARCLTEGVDVPSLDGIAFIDARSSQVDIVQAIGRAIRKGGEQKTLGYIVIPVFLVPSDQIENEIETSRFKPVWDVINALKSHDPSLESDLVEIRRELGRTTDTQRLPSKIVFDLPGEVSLDLRSKIESIILERTTSSWDEFYSKLILFAEANGHCRPRREYTTPEESRLAKWVDTQRTSYNKGNLSQEKIELLEEINHWTWDPFEDQWQRAYQEIKDKAEQQGHSVFSIRGTFSERLASWVNTQRTSYKKGNLSQEKIELLEEINHWTWDPFEDQWQRAYQEIKDKAEQQGHSVFSKRDTFSDGRLIYSWLVKQRREKDNLPLEKIERLERLPQWSWDPIDTQWMENFEILRKYSVDFGNSQVPSTYRDSSGKPLGQWVAWLRAKEGTLSQVQRDLLSALPNWTWDPFEDQWQRAYQEIKDKAEQQGHSVFSKRDTFSDGRLISTWVQNQRREKDNLPLEKRELLEKLPQWSWDPYKDAGEITKAELTKFVKENGHTRVPQRHITESGFKLGSVVGRLRREYARGELDDDWLAFIAKLPGWEWNVLSENWHTKLALLDEFVFENKRLPISGESYKGEKLGKWVLAQRNSHKKGSITESRKLLLESIPYWTWDVFSEKWETGYAHLIRFLELNNGKPPKVGEKTIDGFGIYAWVWNQRNKYYKLTPEQRDRLSQIPWFKPIEK
jgi:superfamily II DNA or RNA helicase